jgi:1,2-diacylglycerol 3-beta-glucosyltransferase
MLHWIVVMAATTTRMAFRPKRLKWVKTVHRGA